MAKNAIEVGVKLSDQMSPGFRKAGRAVTDFQRATKQALDRVRSVLRAAVAPVKKLGSALLNLKTLILGYGAIKLTNFVVGIEDTERSFQNLLTTIGESGTNTLSRLRAAVKGTVSDLDLMATANRAVLLGAAKTGDELELMATLARRLGRAMGRDVKDAFEDLTLGIGRQSKQILDNLAIIVRAEDAYESYARALGKTEDELTDTEKRQAFMNAVIDGAQRRIRSLGPDVETLSDKWGQLGATLKNMATDLLGAFNPLLRDVFGRLQKWLEDNRTAFYDWFAGLLRAADRAIPPIIEAVKRLTSRLWAMVRPLLEIVDLMGQFNIGLAVNDVDLAVGQLQDAAARRERRRRGENPDVLYPGGPAYGPLYPGHAAGTARLAEGGQAGRREGESAAAYLNRLVGVGLIDPMSQEAVRLRAAIDSKKKSEDTYLQLIGQYTTPEDDRGISPLEKAARMVEAAAQEREQSAQYALYQQAEQGRQAAMADVYGATQGPPGLEPTGGAMVNRFNEATAAAQKTHAAIDGATQAFDRLANVGMDTAGQARDAILGIADSFTNNFTNGILEAIEGTKHLRDVFADMAKSVINDIFRIGVRILVLRAIGGIFGGFGFGGIGAGLQHGGVVSTPGVYPLAERGKPEAVVPLSGGRNIPVAFTGQGGGQTIVNNYYTIHATDAQSFDRLFQQSAGRNADMLGNIQRQQYQGRPQLRRAYS